MVRKSKPGPTGNVRASSNGGRAAHSDLPPASPDSVAGELAEHAEWLKWQLMDSAFPTGGFAHSSGLEAAWQQGEVHGRDELVSFIVASLDQLGHASLPLVLAAFDHPEAFLELDDLCEAFTTNHVANRASRAQGRAFLSAMDRIFQKRWWKDQAKGELAFGHFAPVFGASLRHLSLSREVTGRMFFFNHLRSVLAAAVRLNIIGPNEAQVLTHRISPRAGKILQDCSHLDVNKIAQTAPLLDLWQGAHDRLYSRLFQS